MKNKLVSFLRSELMLCVSVLAALLSLLITPPSKALLTAIDWKTLATLFMLLTVLDGFKAENLFAPLLRMVGKIRSQLLLSTFLVFSVFVSSMFVTNDVSLVIFVPLTILLFRAGGKEQYTVPVLVLENIAAVRGSLLTPFGSPQNLFLYGKSGLSTGAFMRMMLPLWLMSIVLLSLFLLFLHRRNTKETVDTLSGGTIQPWAPERKGQRLLYTALFVLILYTIVSRTALWPYITLIVTILLLIFDRKVFRRVDYALLCTFFCFFVFSSSISANSKVSAFLTESVGGHEYLWSILLSQIISNVPASIVLWPYTTNLPALIYGLDSAGLVSIIGSLASVINMRIYVHEYPGQGKKFMLWFEIISLAFFVPVVLLQLLFL